MRVVKAAEMREIDRLAIQDLGIAGVVLMENAARGASRYFLDHFRPSPDSTVLILSGRGNNGGDGYAMARYLLQAGLRVKVAVLSSYDKIQGDALVNLNIIQRLGIDIFEITDKEAWDKSVDLLRMVGIPEPEQKAHAYPHEMSGGQAQRIHSFDVGQIIPCLEIFSWLRYPGSS